jgi:hypothetical protein
MSDIPHSGRPSDFDEDLLNALIQADTHQTTRELASEMGCDHATIVRHLQSMGKVQKLGVWVPHILNEDNKNQHVAICASLLAHHHAHEHQSSYDTELRLSRCWEGGYIGSTDAVNTCHTLNAYIFKTNNRKVINNTSLDSLQSLIYNKTSFNLPPFNPSIQ